MEAATIPDNGLVMVNWTIGADHFHNIEYFIIEAKVADEPWSVVVTRLNDTADIVIGRCASTAAQNQELYLSVGHLRTPYITENLTKIS